MFNSQGNAARDNDVNILHNSEIVKAERASDIEPDKTANPTHFPGRGTSDDPFVVDWDLGDPGNPYTWSHRQKWIITSQV